MNQSEYLTGVEDIEVGDLVFTRIKNFIFDHVARDLHCWSNHVAIVVEIDDDNVWLAESIVPLSRRLTLQKAVDHSYLGYYAIRRVKGGLTDEQKRALQRVIPHYLNVFYHFGFNLASKWQFCSKMVYQIYQEALHLEIGDVENFSTLLQNHDDVDLAFWKLWFLGTIPWQRETITPASQWNSPILSTCYVSNPVLLQPDFQI